MIKYKTEEEIVLLSKSNKLVGDAIAYVAAQIKPGITTLDINKKIHEFISDNNAVPSFLNYSGFPYASCISVNDAVVHGFPSSLVLIEGDVISVDVGVFLNNYHGDSAYTFLLKKENDLQEEKKRLLNVTKQSLYKGIEKAIMGNRLEDISFAIMEHTQLKNKLGVVKDLVGHGIGQDLHEEPQVPNFGKMGRGILLKENLVIAIEPMINLGKKDVYTDSDKWTIKTRDKMPSAHYEHSICVKKDKALILSSFLAIETAEQNNVYLESEFYN